ncbi:TonB-dependent receptor [Peristeroidobacter soli]|uniref:TonB-dependent receptor n=1 Tax=Peristeroidobacter soli TaxID=2497877 RepID=UPI00101BAC6D|nr:TonB-dependent receptor [Peristeroidobacter soli]
MKQQQSLAALAALLLGPSLVAAQSTNDDVMLEEVTVTAQRRAERLQDVPVAVTAFTAAEIEARGVGSTRDILPMTPNVTYDESFTVGNSFVSVRGVAQINNADSPVAIVVDGVPQNSQKQLRMELFDVERIEVLKGPQGALYGRNAIGGAINIVTREPTNDFDGWAQLGAGSGNLRSASGAVSGPIVEDKLLFRLSGAYKDSDGTIENVFLHEKVDFYESKDVRARFMILATDALTIDVRGSYSNIDGGAVMDASMDPALTGNANRKVLPRSNILGNSEREISDATVKIDWRTDVGTLTAITGYTDLTETYYGDLDFCNPVDCPNGIFGLGPQADQRQLLDVTLLSQEVRLASPDDRRLRWIVGGFYLSTQRDLDTIAHLLIPNLPGIPLISNAEENDNDAYSAFAQVDYDITDRTTLGVSLRYDRDEREQTNASDPTRPTRSKSFSDVQPRVVVDHKLTKDQLVYATYGTGFRSGGFNGVGGRPFDAETLQNYEVGYKSTWWDSRLRLNASVFRSRSEDYQFFYLDFNQGGAQVIDNLDKVEFTGAELEWQVQATRYWTLLGAVGLLDTDIKAIDPSLTVPVERGNRTPKTQKSTFSLGSQLEIPLGSLTGTIRVDYGRWGKKYWHPDNVDIRDPVNMLDLRVSIGNERWTATAWGRNVLDEFYWQDFNAVEFGAPGVDLGSPSSPDTYGIDLKYRF